MANPLALLEGTSFSLQFRYMPLPVAAAIYLVLTILVVVIAWRSLAWLGAGRRAAIIGVRLIVLYVLIMLLAGAEATQKSDDLSVIVMRDVSQSAIAARPGGLKDIDDAANRVLTDAAATKVSGDRLGAVAFDSTAVVDALPKQQFSLASRAVRNQNDGTDIASAFNLSMACFDGSSMKRLVLLSDGNATQGDTAAAIAAATAARVPVDVIPIQYRIDQEVMLDRIVAPTWRREGEPFHLEVVLRAAGKTNVSGELTVTQQGLPVDLDAEKAGVQPTLATTLKPGSNVVRVTIPASSNTGVHRFRAVFTPTTGDTMAGNNSAEAFTFVRGKGRFLYVDNYPNGTGSILLEALRKEGIGIADADRILPTQFPQQLVDLQSYDAIILANVPRGPGGLSDAQANAIASYVRDTGGGLLVTGGPDALGAGGWQGSDFSKVLPVDLEVPAKRITPAGALVLVIDHSGSMGGPMPGGTTNKMQSAQQSALLALQTMLPADQIGVVAFDSVVNWAHPLQRRGDAAGATDAIRKLAPDGGTNIYPALDEATRALTKLTNADAGVKHILLLTDGQSVDGDYDKVIARMNDAKITLSTIAIGGDADRNLLATLAQKAGGSAYVVNDPTQLTQVFVREARTIRRTLISEPEDGITPAKTPAPADMLVGANLESLPPLVGMVLTSAKNDPTAHVHVVASGANADPILASWQAGLGRVVVFTSDTTKRWAPHWVASNQFDKIWAQLVRGVARPPMSGDFEVQMVRDGTTTKVIVDALGEAGAINGLSITGTAAQPDPERPAMPLRLQQTSPGRYEGTLETPDAGTYVTAMQFRKPSGERGSLLAGLSISDSLERRDLTSNDQALADIARRTSGRVLPALGTGATYDLFSRADVAPVATFLPLNAILLPLLVGLLLADVAIRRIQIDAESIHRMAMMPVVFVRSFTSTRKIETTQSLDALRRVRQEQTSKTETPITLPTPSSASPDAKFKFEATGELQGDITKIVGGASDQPLPPPLKSRPSPSDSAAGTTGSLFEAKRRAQQRIREQEEGK